MNRLHISGPGALAVYLLTMLVVAIALLALAACGGSTTAPSTSPPAASPSEATAPPTPTPGARMSRPGGQDKLVWEFETGAAVHSRPAVPGSVAYVANDAGRLYAVDVRSGQQRWRFTTGGAILSSLVAAAGAVYCRSDDGYLYAVDTRSGQQRWRFEAGGAAESSPAVGGGRVYIATPSASEPHGDALYALDGGSGRVIWKASLTWKLAEGDAPTSITSPAVSGGVVYYGAGGILYALDGATGERLWMSSPRWAQSRLMSGTPAVVHRLIFTRVLANWPFSRVLAWTRRAAKWHGDSSCSPRRCQRGSSRRRRSEA
jgi:hypothetical protein